MTTKEDIKQVVWQVCDHLRKTLEPSDLNVCVVSMLFVKYLSDASKEKYETTNRKYFMKDDAPIFDFLYANRRDAKISQKISAALKQIEGCDNGIFRNLFQNLNFNSAFEFVAPSKRNALLRNLLEEFNELDLRPSRLESVDVVGDVYESLLATFDYAAGKADGESFTPSQVSELAVALLQPEENDRVYDPVCGCGGILTKARKKAPNGKVSLYGQELSPRNWSLCTMNMFLHGVEDACIWQGNIFSKPQNVENGRLTQFEVVAAHPPYGLRDWNKVFLTGTEKSSKAKTSASLDAYRRFDLGFPPSSNADYAFILHMLASLEPERGRMAVILPHGVLFRGGGEREIRRRLAEMNLIDAVVGLPANLFYGTSIPACILVFKKNRSRRDVLFIDASADGNFERVGRRNILREGDITRIVGVYQRWENVRKYSRIVSFKEIEENDFDLNISRYVDAFDEEDRVNLNAIQQNIAKIEAELSKVQEQMTKRWNEFKF